MPTQYFLQRSSNDKKIFFPPSFFTHDKLQRIRKFPRAYEYLKSGKYRIENRNNYAQVTVRQSRKPAEAFILYTIGRKECRDENALHSGFWSVYIEESRAWWRGECIKCVHGWIYGNKKKKRKKERKKGREMKKTTWSLKFLLGIGRRIVPSSQPMNSCQVYEFTIEIILIKKSCAFIHLMNNNLWRESLSGAWKKNFFRENNRKRIHFSFF